MSGWIKFWKDMPSDPRVLASAVKLSERYTLAQRTDGGGTDLSGNALCNALRNAVVGALVTLWAYADEHIRDDDTLELTSQTLDAVVGLEGFFDIMPREWIYELDGGRIALPGYCEKNSLIAKRKRTVKSNARVTRWRGDRKRNGNGVGNGVTGRHVTQHTRAVDRDQDLYRDQDQERVIQETPATRSQTEIHTAFLAFKAAYPEFAGRRDWMAAEHAYHRLLERGVTPELLLKGLALYRAYIDCAVNSTAYVMRPEKFLSAQDDPWNQAWTLPENKTKSAAAKITWHPEEEPAAAKGAA